MHLAAGKTYGKDATCGPDDRPKQRLADEEQAVRAAEAASQRYNRDLEGYPCYWCHTWHVGRTMTSEERAQFLEGS